MENLYKFSIKTNKYIELVDITDKVNNSIKDSKVNSGICLIYCPHTTAGITINENADPSVKNDIKNFLKDKIPHESYFTHFEGNSPSHIMSSLIGASETIIIENSKPILGTWQAIYFAEFDGPRTRSFYVKIIGDFK